MECNSEKVLECYHPDGEGWMVLVLCSDILCKNKVGY